MPVVTENYRVHKSYWNAVTFIHDYESGKKKLNCTLERSHWNVRNQGVQFVGRIFILVPLARQTNTYTEGNIPEMSSKTFHKNLACVKHVATYQCHNCWNVQMSLSKPFKRYWHNFNLEFHFKPSWEPS